MTKKVLILLLALSMACSTMFAAFAIDEDSADEDSNQPSGISTKEQSEQANNDEIDANFALETTTTEPLSEANAMQPQPTNEVYNLVFSKKDKTTISVDFNEMEKPLGLNGTPGQTGIWVFKSYFIGWSENKNYIAEGTGHLFYETATASDVKQAGIESGTTLYALYASSSIASNMKELTSVNINNDVDAESFVNNGKPIKDSDKTTCLYNEKDESYDINTLVATFKMNPFVAAAIYKDPWVGAMENGSAWGKLGYKTGNITVVDLHVTLDKRLELPDEFSLTFKSYVFRPFSVRSAIKADGTPVGDNEEYPYIGVDQQGDKPNYGVVGRIEDNNPSTTFKTKSYLINDKGEKVRVYDYIIRTRIRTGYDSYGNKIKPITMEQIISDMKLSLTNSKFTVTNDTAKKIAEKKEGPIEIKGSIDGLTKGIYWGAINSEIEKLDFEKAKIATVNYVDESGKAITNPVIIEGRKGEAYETEKKNINGYKFKKMADGSAPASGNFGDENLTVTYVYTKDTPVPTNPKEKIRIIVDPNGGNWSGDHSNKIYYLDKGDVFTLTEAPVRDGYTFQYWKGSEYQPGDKYTVKENHTFVAEWKKNNELHASIDSKETETSPNKSSAVNTPNTADNQPIALALSLTLVLLASIAMLQKKKNNVK